MATLRKTSTAAKTTCSFTVEDVLETARYLSSKELRAYQAKLTNTSRELIRLTELRTGLDSLLNPDERELIQEAGALVKTVAQRIEQAKNQKIRQEKIRAKEFEDRIKRNRQLVEEVFPFPTDTLEQQLEVVRGALVLNRLRFFQSFHQPHSFAAKLRQEALESNNPLPTIYRYRALMREAIQDETFPYNDDLRSRLEALQSQYLNIRNQVVLAEAATIACWSKVLSLPKNVGGK